MVKRVLIGQKICENSDFRSFGIGSSEQETYLLWCQKDLKLASKLAFTSINVLVFDT